MSDLCLKVMSSLGLLQLALAIALGLVFDSVDQHELLFWMVKIESIFVHAKEHAFAIQFVNDKALCVDTVIGNTESFLGDMFKA